MAHTCGDAAAVIGHQHHVSGLQQARVERNTRTRTHARTHTCEQTTSSTKRAVAWYRALALGTRSLRGTAAQGVNPATEREAVAWGARSEALAGSKSPVAQRDLISYPGLHLSEPEHTPDMPSLAGGKKPKPSWGHSLRLPTPLSNESHSFAPSQMARDNASASVSVACAQQIRARPDVPSVENRFPLGMDGSLGCIRQA
ncbi:hypothetical protein G7Z17_g5579 [Cylindrodendrum hubeiense]|uniref:Uncharacterized protein n=1 Tax=Cylindrodendrum hubeiense TaxID=595255 RepID=A0A9P5H8P7_9HYPO|nr:hypothetical protein G7Z17_g5579 [Cylindrodendrum hubeiense]